MQPKVPLSQTVRPPRLVNIYIFIKSSTPRWPLFRPPNCTSISIEINFPKQAAGEKKTLNRPIPHFQLKMFSPAGKLIQSLPRDGTNQPTARRRRGPPRASFDNLIDFAISRRRLLLLLDVVVVGVVVWSGGIQILVHGKSLIFLGRLWVGEFFLAIKSNTCCDKKYDKQPHRMEVVSGGSTRCNRNENCSVLGIII